MPTDLFSHRQAETALAREARASLATAAEGALASAWPEGTAALRAFPVITRNVTQNQPDGWLSGQPTKAL